MQEVFSIFPLMSFTYTDPIKTFISLAFLNRKDTILWAIWKNPDILGECVSNTSSHIYLWHSFNYKYNSVY